MPNHSKRFFPLVQWHRSQARWRDSDLFQALILGPLFWLIVLAFLWLVLV